MNISTQLVLSVLLIIAGIFFMAGSINLFSAAFNLPLGMAMILVGVKFLP